MKENNAFNEKEVIRQVLSGQKDEYRHLVRRHQDRIFGLIMRQIPDEDMARELTQDVMIRAYVHLPKFRFESAFSTWLTRIALNVTNSYFSSRSYKKLASTLPLEKTVLTSTAPNADAELMHKRAMLTLKLCLGELKAKYREVIVLCAFEGRSYEEAARVLEVPVGTVCSRLDTARGLLRKKMKQVLV